MRNYIKDALLGLATGDALGVPVEFHPRSYFINHPVSGMQAYGTHRQPAGTWSDDSSLAFCLAEMLCGGYDPRNLANRFVNWYDFGYWTPHGIMFDVGNATSEAIARLRSGAAPLTAGGKSEQHNGNGSLMRILPLLFYIKDLPVETRFRYTQEISSLTHAHIRSVIACFLYLEFALLLLQGTDKHIAYHTMRVNAAAFLTEQNLLSEKEAAIFHHILSGELPDLPIEQIHGTGYVLHTLEAALWCLLNTTTYTDAVLTAIHLGDDTDTTATVTGGLAGLLYSWENIPTEWLDVLVKKKEIEDLAARLHTKVY